MFFERYSHERRIAVARYWIQHVGMTRAQRARLPARLKGGRATLAVMESRPRTSCRFVGDEMSIQ
ncbi:MAG: hypothetical protein OXU81_18875 [Gammaproteobacteria bacterium]|nr:hypothetical protein [Gammaproteobacteria bacterium]